MLEKEPSGTSPQFHPAPATPGCDARRSFSLVHLSIGPLATPI